MKHIAVRITIVLLVCIVVLGLATVLFSFLGQSFSAAVQWVNQWGDVEILTDDTIVGEPILITEAPITTIPPGDDPSWSNAMPQAPVDITSEELAQQEQAKSGG